MKYFESGDILLSDFDGVYLDSQERYYKTLSPSASIEAWIEFLNSIKWNSFLRECEELPGASETFLELQELKILRGFITRIHSYEEGKEKAIFLREKGLYVPIYYVLPEQRKSMVYPPNQHVKLLDDDLKNCDEWEKEGGSVIHFNPQAKENNKKLVKSLPDLLSEFDK